MDTVKNILEIKGNMVYTVCPDNTVYEALEILQEKNLGSLVVLEDDGTLDGIFTERDYARKVILKGRSSRETLVRDIMTEDPIFVSPDTEISDCMKLMSQRFVRHLPVLDNGKLVGLVSIGDLVNYIISQKDNIIEHLEHYISS